MKRIHQSIKIITTSKDLSHTGGGFSLRTQQVSYRYQYVATATRSLLNRTAADCLHLILLINFTYQLPKILKLPLQQRPLMTET